MLKPIKTAVASVVVVLSVGCESISAPIPTALDVAAHHVALTAPGIAVSLAVTPRSGADILPASAAHYVSRDTNIARVDEDGVVRAFGAGHTVIDVTAGGLADTIGIDVAFDRPVWRFTLTGAISNVTANGLDAAGLRRNFQRHVDTVNARFNVPAAFAGYVHLVVAETYIFTRPPREELAEAPTRTDFKVVYHTDKTYTNADYAADKRVVQIGALPDSAFSEQKAWVLTHELGHARGAVDIDGADVQPQSNPVNGQSHFTPPSIMNGDQVRVWDDYSRYLINRGGSERDAFLSWFSRTAEMVPAIAISVRSATDDPVADATVRIYWDVCSGDPASLNAVCGIEPAARQSLQTGGDGMANVRPRNMGTYTEPFALLQLVTVSKGASTGWAWVPLTDIAKWALVHPGESYPQTIVLAP